MPTLAELKAENLDAWARDVHAGDYALVVNTSCSRYIVALEAEVERLEKARAFVQNEALKANRAREDWRDTALGYKHALSRILSDLNVILEDKWATDKEFRYSIERVVANAEAELKGTNA